MILAKPVLIVRWVLLVGSLLVLGPRAASAQSGRVVLVLAELGSPSERLEAGLLGALRGQLRELQVEVLVARAAREPLAIASHRAKQIAAREHALGVIWVELSAGLSAFLYDASGHLYVREVDADGSAASQSEALAIILRSAIAAMLEGDAVAMNEIAVPPSKEVEFPARGPELPPPRTSTPPVAQSSHLRAGASYVTEPFVRGSPWQHGVGLALSLHPGRSRWFLGLDYTHFPRVGLEAAGTEIRLARHPLELFAGANLRLRSLDLEARSALSADYVQRTTIRVNEGWSATADSGRWLWAVSARVGVTVPLTQRFFGFLNGGIDFLLNPFSQAVAASPSGTEAMSSLVRARPRAEVGLMISAW